MTEFKDKYWFSEEDPKEVVKHFGNPDDSHTIWTTNPMVQTWIRNYIAYYSHILEPAAWDTSLTFMGEQGELIKMVVPQARSLIRQLCAIVTKQKLAFQCIAETSSEDSVNTVRLGNAVATEVVIHQNLDQKGDAMTELALVAGTGYLLTTWRTDKGQPYAIGEENNVFYTGDVEIIPISVFDLTRDYSIENWEEVEWVRVRRKMNRWNLIAQHPDLAQEIKALPSIRQDYGIFRTQYYSASEDDLVYVYEVYHKPTPALPNGRMLFYSSVDTIYFDGDNLYGCIPIAEMKPEPVQSTGFGAPKFSELLPCQEMLDTMFSSICTNNASFAVQNIAVPRGAGISAQDIAGMNWFSYTPMPGVPGGGKPEAIQLTSSAPETFKLIDLLEGHMQQLSLINGALRGDPPAGVTAGNALATLTANALEFVNSVAKSYRQAIKTTMKHAFNAYQNFAKAEQYAKIIGKNNTTYFKKFTGEDLKSVREIDMTEVNPVMQTIAGRLDLAEKLLQGGFVKTAQDYIKVLDGEPASVMYEDEQSENDLIKSENENLLEGKPVIILATDDHALHIRKHAALLNHPDVRMKNMEVQKILDHIMEHNQQARSVDPMLTAMVRTGEMPQGAPPPPSGPGPKGPPEMQPGSGNEEAMGQQPSMQPAEPAKDMLGRQ